MKHSFLFFQLTNPKLQEDWLRTLTALKTKDPRIYQKDYYFFEDQGESLVGVGYIGV